ncbi:uncharacterized protein LOC120144627 [Hibiscus syriacus]|uniref:uncharacterized protein LOC120144627 n=1 Tax=Hibiscus syriacus TaxID=106335 RepID=UPI001923B1E0|nr:uncharacterized protein LOC120144627 [Hibiscus syriacus]
MLPSVPIAENSALVTQSSSSSRTKKGRPVCDFCKKVGHLKDQCWKLHGKPGKWKPSSPRTPHESHSKIDNPVSNGVFSQEQIAVLQKMFSSMGDSRKANVVLTEEEGTGFEEDGWQC